METLTISILQEEALPLLKEMSDNSLIKIEKEDNSKFKTIPNNRPYDPEAFIKKFYGAMTKQPIEEVEAQLKELRHG